MATYFDPSEQDDLALLPADLREPTAKELKNLAAEAEHDVILAFTDTPVQNTYTQRETFPAAVDVSTSTEVPMYVYLRGYAVDPTAADANLADALRRTIADVVRWRFTWKERMKLGVETEGTADGVSKTMRPWSDNSFPQNWDWRLRPYDTREPAVVI